MVVKHRFSTFGIVVFIISILLAPSIKAQQITSTTTPETRNPQPTQTELIDSSTNIQDNSSDVLRSETEASISIPEGIPAKNPSNEASAIKKSTNPVLVVSGVVVMFFAMLTVIIYALGAEQNDGKTKLLEQPIKETPIRSTDKTIKNESKKKKRRAKSKKSSKK